MNRKVVITLIVEHDDDSPEVDKAKLADFFESENDSGTTYYVETDDGAEAVYTSTSVDVQVSDVVDDD